MRKLKNDRPFYLRFLLSVGQILIAIGTPPLFALKLLLWSIIWIGNQTLFLTQSLISILVGLVDTSFWLFSILYHSFFKLYSLIRNHLHKSYLSFDRLIQQKFSVPAHKRLRLFQTQLTKKRSRRLNTTFIKNQISKRTLQIHLTADALFARLSPSRRQFYLVTLSLSVICFLFILTLGLYHFFTSLPNPKLLAERNIPVTTKIYDRHGVLLYQFYKDENRTIVNLDSLPSYISDATVSIEDRNFYKHLGVDPQGIIRAALANSQGEIVQGGSTITQQLVRQAFLTPDRNLVRKLKEIVLAFETEHQYSKKEILRMYLNDIPFGGEAYGIEAAAEYYFGKPAKDLSLAQAALLTGLISAPSAYSPFGPHPQLAKIRQEEVLNVMAQQGYITSLQAQAAAKEVLTFAPRETEIKAPHFVMYIKDYLAQKYGLDRLEQGGLQIITSLDYSLYESVMPLVKDGVLAQKYLNVGNGAVLITNPNTGEILTMIGSTDFFDSDHDGNVNVTLAERSPGSSIKPFNYALAFERNLITPSTIINDTPTIYQIPGSSPYMPTNYDNRFHGPVSVRVALGSSYNVPAVKVLERNGVENFIRFAQALGITTFTDTNRYGLALTLGGGEVKMIDLATAYSAFANSGQKVNLNPILQIKDYKGNLIEDSKSYKLQATSSVLSPRTAFLISSILADDSARAPTFGAGSILNVPGHTVSVKTGTTETKRDNWTIGYSFGPDPRLVAVWVGNNDNSPMSPYLESGNTGAAAIWNPIMKLVLKDQPDNPIPRPSDLVEVKVCSLTGTLTCDNCPVTTTEYFLKGNEPKTACHLTKDDLDRFLHRNDKP